MRPRLEGRNPQRGKNAERGSAGGIRVKPLRCERTSQVLEILELRDIPREYCIRLRAARDESRDGYWEGETSGSRTPWTDSAWNKAEKAQAEQNVKRLRKPEGAAQSGEVNPAQVASCAETRRRGKKPHGRVIR